MTTNSDQPAMPTSDARQEQLRALADPDQPLVKKSVTLFSDLHRHEVAALRPTWRTLSAERRQEFVQALRTLAEDNSDLDFRQFFLGCLDDPEDRVRAIAVDGLWEDRSSRTLEWLLSLVHDPAGEVRVAAVLGLSRFAYMAEMEELRPEQARAVCTTLLDVAADPTQPITVRRRAVEALGYFANSPEAQTEVARAYEHADQMMRESALVGMGRSMHPQWFASIRRELRSPSPAMRYEAARAVGELAEDGREMLPALLPLVDDADLEVAQAAIWALGQVGSDQARQTLKRLTRTSSEARQQAAEEALEELALFAAEEE